MSFESHQSYFCQFCNEHIATSDDMRAHLWLCASKTDQCPNCQQYIKRSIIGYHIENFCSDSYLSDEVRENNSDLIHN